MMKKMCLLLALCLLLTGCAAAPAETEPLEVTGSLTIQYLEEGALLLCNGEALLIDCGSGLTGEALSRFGVEDLNCILLTGCDEARTGALTTVLEQFPAPVYGPGPVADIPVTVPKAGERMYLDCAGITVLSPLPGCEESLALRVDFGDHCFLFAGAPEEDAQRKLTEYWSRDQDLTADMLHLFGDASLTEELAAAVRPRYGIVSGKGSDVLSALLEQTGTEVFATGDYGPITVETDGSGMQISWRFHVSDSVAS